MPNRVSTQGCKGRGRGRVQQPSRPLIAIQLFFTGSIHPSFHPPKWSDKPLLKSHEAKTQPTLGCRDRTDFALSRLREEVAPKPAVMQKKWRDL